MGSTSGCSALIWHHTGNQIHASLEHAAAPPGTHHWESVWRDDSGSRMARGPVTGPVFWKETSTVEPVLKDHPIGHKKLGLSRQVVFGDRFNYRYIEMLRLLPKIFGPSRQVVFQERFHYTGSPNH